VQQTGVNNLCCGAAFIGGIVYFISTGDPSGVQQAITIFG